MNKEIIEKVTAGQLEALFQTAKEEAEKRGFKYLVPILSSAEEFLLGLVDKIDGKKNLNGTGA